MLQEIRITNFAIIENLAIEFHSGLNVLTGETGAGKSIIIDALNLILGGRADTDTIRSGASTATVEACLKIDDPQTLALIADLGIEVDDGQVIIKRIISNSDKNRTYLNNSNLTVAALSKIGDRLIDIHGQHDHQSLLYPETHVDLLDHYGKLMKDRATFQEHYAAYQKTVQTLKQMQTHQGERLQRQDLLNFQIGEIDQAGLSVGEDDDLKTEKNKLNHAEKLHQSVQNALDLLADADGAALELLGRVDRELQGLPEIDPALEAQAQRGQTAFLEAQELAEELRDYQKGIEFNPARLEEIEDRLAEINGLKRKYGNDIATILEYRETIGAELEALSMGEESMDALKADIKSKQKALAGLATDLAKKREQAAEKIKKDVEKELRDLSMKHVQFGMSFVYEPDADGFTTYKNKKTRTHANGIGEIEFLFSPNPGEELRPLAKIASGGEISRVMLALKSILNDQDPVPVMVFDEVDSGISGGVAEKVGVKLKKISAQKQIFCITHLPQIAGMADSHYRVHKTVSGKRTRSTIIELDYEHRVEEIARMSGGETITETTLKHAREMIK
ncbi:MAG: DNA repair protein RecN [Nitrospinota bacterium]|nr:DNA repair protein RecN [Nitrospinota bacterium]